MGTPKKPKAQSGGKPKSGYMTRLAKLESELQLQIAAHAELRSSMEEDYGSFINVLADMNKRIERVEAKDKPEPPKPTEYVLTDADWQRVIDECYLCEFGTNEQFSTRYVDFLESGPPKYSQFRAVGGFRSAFCRPLNRPGVMQPYFGQGMPVAHDTKVVIQWNDGYVGTGTTDEKYWDWALRSDGRKVIAFMVLP